MQAEEEDPVRRGGGRAIAPFLSKTYRLVDDPTTNEYISWSPEENSFVVWRPVEMAREVLPKVFKHNNFSSFVRQLNTYGFRKVTPERWEFANECFVKGNRGLLSGITRRKSNVTSASVAAADRGDRGGAGGGESGGGGGGPGPLAAAGGPSTSPHDAGASAAAATATATAAATSAENEHLRRDSLLLQAELSRLRALYKETLKSLLQMPGGEAAAAMAAAAAAASAAHGPPELTLLYDAGAVHAVGAPEPPPPPPLAFPPPAPHHAPLSSLVAALSPSFATFARTVFGAAVDAGTTAGPPAPPAVVTSGPSGRPPSGGPPPPLWPGTLAAALLSGAVPYPGTMPFSPLGLATLAQQLLSTTGGAAGSAAGTDPPSAGAGAASFWSLFGPTPRVGMAGAADVFTSAFAADGPQGAMKRKADGEPPSARAGAGGLESSGALPVVTPRSAPWSDRAAPMPWDTGRHPAIADRLVKMKPVNEAVVALGLRDDGGEGGGGAEAGGAKPGTPRHPAGGELRVDPKSAFDIAGGSRRPAWPDVATS